MSLCQMESEGGERGGFVEKLNLARGQSHMAFLFLEKICCCRPISHDVRVSPPLSARVPADPALSFAQLRGTLIILLLHTSFLSHYFAAHLSHLDIVCWETANHPVQFSLPPVVC